MMNTTASSMQTYQLEPEQNADACVIWLHGLGASYQDFVPVVPHLKLPNHQRIRFLFPQAPSISVTCNGGIEMPAWYDILALTEIRKINQAHLDQTRQQIIRLIHQQVKNGIPASRIVLIGFSQGGAVAYHTALHYLEPLAGLIALSTYLPNPDTLPETPIHSALPIRIAHGLQDDVVTTRASQLAHSWLIDQGFQDVSWSPYSMAHELCLPEIRDIGKWIHAILKE